jgi:hypothetical protein
MCMFQSSSSPSIGTLSRKSLETDAVIRLDTSLSRARPQMSKQLS